MNSLSTQELKTFVNIQALSLLAAISILLMNYNEYLTDFGTAGWWVFTSLTTCFLIGIVTSLFSGPSPNKRTFYQFSMILYTVVTAGYLALVFYTA